LNELGEAIDFYHSLLDDEIGIQSQAQLTASFTTASSFSASARCALCCAAFSHLRSIPIASRAIRSVMPAFTKAHVAAWLIRLFGPSSPGGLGRSSWCSRPRLSRSQPDGAHGFVFRHRARFSHGRRPGEGLYWPNTTPKPRPDGLLRFAVRGLSASAIMGAFQRRYETRPLPARHHVLHALLDAYRQWGGRDRRASPSWIGARCPPTVSSCYFKIILPPRTLSGHR